MSEHPEIPVIDLSGTPSEIGTAHGEAQRERVRECADRFISWVCDGASIALDEKSLWEKWKPQLAFSESVAPDLVEEMHGIARGSGVAFERVFLLNSMLDLVGFHYLPMTQNFGCTTFATVTDAGSGRTLIGQTYDMPKFLRESLLILRIRPAEGPRQLIFTFAGIVGACGFNDAGVGLSINFLSPLDTGIGRLHSHVVRQILASDNLADALTSPAVPPRAGGAHYLVAHEGGDIASLETTGKRMEMFLPEGNSIGHTNHYLGTTLKNVELVRESSIGSSLARYAALQRHMRVHGNFLDIDSLKELTRDHASHPRSICAHPPDTVLPQQATCTVAAIIQDLSERAMHITNGCACENDYHAVRL